MYSAYYQTKENFSQIRYDRGWSDRSDRARRLLGGYCTLCSAPSACTHHARYVDSSGPLRGREVPGADIFPLCKRCHAIAHRPGNWHWHRGCPALLNRNDLSFWKQLRSGWLAKRSLRS